MSYYMDYFDGSQRWTSLIAGEEKGTLRHEVLRAVAERSRGRLAADLGRVAVMGYSMGGVGALRVASGATAQRLGQAPACAHRPLDAPRAAS